MGEAGRDPPVSVHLGTITEGSNEVYMHCHDESFLYGDAFSCAKISE